MTADEVTATWGLLPDPRGTMRAGTSEALVPDAAQVVAATACLYSNRSNIATYALNIESGKTKTYSAEQARVLANEYNNDAVRNLPPGWAIARVNKGWHTITVFAYDRGPDVEVARAADVLATNGAYRGYLLTVPAPVSPNMGQ